LSNNALHVAKVIKDTLSALQLEVLHAAYSPEYAPSDYFDQCSTALLTSTSKHMKNFFIGIYLLLEK